MKIRIECQEDIKEDEILIRTNHLDEEIQQLTKSISALLSQNKNITFYKGDTVYYLSLQDILFFETESGEIYAHTEKEVYRTKYKLYELEALLPACFMRISKSAIVNIKRIYALTTSFRTCVIAFKNTHKQVYVSRSYYKPLKDRLEEKR